MDKIYDVIILGSGPAGLTAAIYTTRANLKTLVIAGVKWGGQLMLTTLVENYPGFPDGIQGPDLMMAMRKQAERFGTEVKEIDISSADFTSSPFKITAEGKTFEGKSVIIATGADTKWLDVPGEKEKIGRGVSSCATCDAPFFRGKNVIVVGGGDTAMEDATFLTNFANSITVIHRRDKLRASSIMQDKARKNPKIRFLFNTTVEEILGDQKVERVKLKSPFSVIPNSFRDPGSNDLPAGKAGMLKPFGLAQGGQVQHDNEPIVWEMPIDGVFVAIGHFPNSKVFSSKGRPASGWQGIDVDERGYIKVRNHYHTNVPGVFVGGDVHDAEYKQAVTAAGYGCAAALEAEKWLRE